jgi:hypothetical protein
MEEKPRVRIENWKIVEWVWVDGVEVLVGRCYDHPLIQDGELIRTSEVVKKDFDNNIVETKNTIYLLGKAKAE